MKFDIDIISNIVGLMGVCLIITSFFLLQMEKFKPNSMGYLLFNFFGALMMLFSLYYNWNLASVIIECLWLIITIYGIFKFKIINKT